MFKLTDYILIPKDFKFFGKTLWQRSHYTDFLGLFTLFICALVFGWFFSAPIEPLFFFCFIMVMIYWSLDSRVSIALALVCLVLTPICLFFADKNYLFQGEDWAEKLAVWAFYFLVIGVVKQMFELKYDK